MERALMPVLITVYVCFIAVQIGLSSASSKCGCCPSEDCGARSPCSPNMDCVCLRMTINGGGLCGVVLSCKNLTACHPDNKTCSTPNTVCVDNTRCGLPVCYPVEFASPEQCPPVDSQNASTTTSITTSTTTTITTTTTTTTSTTTTTTTTTSTTASCNLFRNQITYNTGNGSGSIGVAVADVDGDSKPDIVVANQFAGNVGVLLNQGSGVFGSQTTYITGGGPIAVTVADVNNDGKPDIILANFDSWNVGVLLNEGDGTFGNHTTYNTGYRANPIAVAVVDVNNDSQPDIIVVNSNAQNVGVFLNQGNGIFGSQTTYNTGSGPTSVAVVDVNSDSKPDIIVTNSGSYNVVVLFNQGSGVFGSKATYSAVIEPYSVAVIDLNDDSRPDIIVANSGGANVAILLNQGSGVFGSPSTYSTGINSAPRTIAVVDVNNDSKPDIIVGNSNAGNVGVLLNQGSGVFGSQSTFSTGNNSVTRSVAVVDVNNDSEPDIIVANHGSHNVGVFLHC